jgi:hypothetical protein
MRTSGLKFVAYQVYNLSREQTRSGVFNLSREENRSGVYNLSREQARSGVPATITNAVCFLAHSVVDLPARGDFIQFCDTDSAALEVALHPPPLALNPPPLALHLPPLGLCVLI